VRPRKLPDGKNVTGEYDILLYNGTSVAIIEVKHRVRRDAFKRLIEVQMPRFRQIFPEYKDCKMYLGLGATIITPITANNTAVCTIGKLLKRSVLKDGSCRLVMIGIDWLRQRAVTETDNARIQSMSFYDGGCGASLEDYNKKNGLSLRCVEDD
jgi:hypothetical protein